MKKKILLSAALLFCALSFAQTRTRNSSNTSQSSTSTITGRTGSRVSKSDVTYKNNNRKTTVYRTVPTNTKQVKTNTKTYQYNAKDGSYYTSYGSNKYVKVAPDRGLRVQTLPVGYKRVTHNTNVYFFFNGIFYTGQGNNYEVVYPEIGTVVDALPVDYEKVTIDGQLYYEYNGILYERIRTANGRAYEVVAFLD